MIVVGGTLVDIGYGVGSGAVGHGTLDCGDTSDHNVGFVVSEAIHSMSTDPLYAGYGDPTDFYVAETALAIAHEAGHTYGLPHSTPDCDVMSYGLCLVTKDFLDQTASLAADSLGNSGSCGLSTMNAHQMVLKVLGADTVPPRVSITEPKTGAKVAATLTVKGHIRDSGKVSGELLVDGAAQGQLEDGAFTAELTLTPGQHSITVNALDAMKNQGTSVQVEMEAATGSPTSTTDTTDTTDPTTPSSDGDESSLP